MSTVPGCLGLPRHRRGHQHTVAVDSRYALTDRCLSGLLWSTVARAIMLGKPVRLDREPLDWDTDGARAYLDQQHPKWSRGLPERAGS